MYHINSHMFITTVPEHKWWIETDCCLCTHPGPLYTNRTLIILAKPSPWRSLHHKGTRRCMWIPPQRPGEALSFFQARKIAHLSLTAAVTLKREYEAEKERANRANHLSPIFPTLTRLSLSGGFSLHSPHPSNRTESIFDVASELVHLLGPKTLNKGVLSVAVRRHQVTHKCEKSCFEKALSWMMRLARRSILMVSRHGPTWSQSNTPLHAGVRIESLLTRSNHPVRAGFWQKLVQLLL